MKNMILIFPEIYLLACRVDGTDDSYLPMKYNITSTKLNDIHNNLVTIYWPVLSNCLKNEKFSLQQT